MKSSGYLLVTILFSFSRLAIAAETGEPEPTAGNQITFAPSTEAAFDHSGSRVIHSILADGSRFADHNGSMGNVSVARLGADGNIETFCTTDEAAARAWLTAEANGKNNAISTASIMVKRP